METTNNIANMLRSLSTSHQWNSYEPHGGLLGALLSDLSCACRPTLSSWLYDKMICVEDTCLEQEIVLRQRILIQQALIIGVFLFCWLVLTDFLSWQHRFSGRMRCLVWHQHNLVSNPPVAGCRLGAGLGSALTSASALTPPSPELSTFLRRIDGRGLGWGRDNSSIDLTFTLSACFSTARTAGPSSVDIRARGCGVEGLTVGLTEFRISDNESIMEFKLSSRLLTALSVDSEWVRGRRDVSVDDISASVGEPHLFFLGGRLGGGGLVGLWYRSMIAHEPVTEENGTQSGFASIHGRNFYSKW